MPIHHYASIQHHHPRHHRATFAIIHVLIPEDKQVPLTPALRIEYIKLYKTQVLRNTFKDNLQLSLKQILAGKPRYQAVSARTGVPWYVIGIIHLLECDSNFSCHLHNGDPLKAKTIHVPSGRPPGETWTWEDSAVDALQLDGFDKWTDWGLDGTLFRLEAYNGFGSRNHGVPSPYLWSGTQFYKTGKYGSDGKWNPKLTSGQLGAAPIVKALIDKKYITIPTKATK